MKHYNADLETNPDAPGVSTATTDNLPNPVKVIGVDVNDNNRIVDVPLDPSVVFTQQNELVPIGNVQFFISTSNKVITYTTMADIPFGDQTTSDVYIQISVDHPVTGVTHHFRADTNYHSRGAGSHSTGFVWTFFVGSNWEYSPSGTFDGDVSSTAPWFNFANTPCSLVYPQLVNYQGTILSVPVT